ncbi:DUF4974 domain-containing protein [Alcaligenaceae bacterium SJ-26]|nr:DUF4974 domain-containing protein [Alcaligenaceae bacterium SJ-26]
MPISPSTSSLANAARVSVNSHQAIMPDRIDEQRVEKALTLIARAAIDVPEASAKAEEALSRWRARSPENAAACIEAHHRWQMLAQLAPELREQFDAPAAGRHHPQRRQLLACLAGAGITGLLGSSGWWAYRHTPQFVSVLDNTSLLPESFAIPDGPDGQAASRIVLAPSTRLQVSLSRAERTATLDQGEAYFAIAQDRARPFRVRTQAGDIEVLGTAFSVSVRTHAVAIEVEHGHVRFAPYAAGIRRLPLFAPPAIDLYQGQALTIRTTGVAQSSQVNPEQVAAWRDGWLIFDNARLDDALPTINAYRRTPLILQDQRTGQLRLTGRFRTDDPDSLLRALPVILPLNIVTHPDGSLRLAVRTS